MLLYSIYVVGITYMWIGPFSAIVCFGRRVAAGAGLHVSLSHYLRGPSDKDSTTHSQYYVVDLFWL